MVDASRVTAPDQSPSLSSPSVGAVSLEVTFARPAAFFCGSAPRGAALASTLGALLRQVGCGRETRPSRHERMLGLRQVRGGCAAGGPGGVGLHYVWK